MAVTPTLLLEDDSDVETSSDEEALINASILDSEEIHLTNLQKRITNIGDHFPLRKEALVLLEQASKFMANVKKQKKISDTKSSMVAPLYQQLESLRNLIPHSQLGESSCVIMDALGYLEGLKKEIQGLQEGMMKQLSSNAFSATRPPQNGGNPCNNMVEVACLQPGLRIHVCCEKREGLMADLMLSLEALGLVFDHVNVSCHNCLVFEALTTQENVGAIGEEAVRRAILRAIYTN